MLASLGPLAREHHIEFQKIDLMIDLPGSIIRDSVSGPLSQCNNRLMIIIDTLTVECFIVSKSTSNKASDSDVARPNGRYAHRKVPQPVQPT